jgi:hypothetical protein
MFHWNENPSPQAKNFIGKQKELDVDTIDLVFHAHVLHDDDTLDGLNIENYKAAFFVDVRSTEPVLLQSFKIALRHDKTE